MTLNKAIKYGKEKRKSYRKGKGISPSCRNHGSCSCVEMVGGIMLKKLKDILNTYTDEELEDMELWVNCESSVSYIIVDKNNMNLITKSANIVVDGYVEQEGE